jgi:hypothetical protein
MGGSYVALPPQAYTYEIPADVPLNWRIGWGFPGPPFPPGYNPVFELSATGPSQISPEQSAAVFSTLVDTQEGKEYAAGKQADEENQTWIADLDGSPVGMREGGFGSYDSELIVPYTQAGLFWQCSIPDLEFEITKDDIGSLITITFTTKSAPEEAYLEIEVQGVVIYGIVYDQSAQPLAGASVQYTSKRNAKVESTTSDGDGYYEVIFLAEDDPDGYTTLVTHPNEAKDLTPDIDAKGIGEHQEDFYFTDPSMTINTDMFWSSTDSQEYIFRVEGGSTGHIEFKWTTGVGFATDSSGVFTSIFGPTSGANLSLGQGHCWIDGSADADDMALLEGDTFTVKVTGERDKGSPLPGDLIMSWDWLWRTYTGPTSLLTGESRGDYFYYLAPAEGPTSFQYTIGTLTDGVIEQP